ncbi:MAG: hypothetical protein ACYSU0_01190 [Planctomycetota bacterium]|jgi:hypothetical protein
MKPTDLRVREQTASSDGPLSMKLDGSYTDVYFDNTCANMFVTMKGTYFSDSSSGAEDFYIFDHDVAMGLWNTELLSPPPGSPAQRARVALRGRLLLRNQYGMNKLVLDPNASRFHGASIAGIVVGAMGVFVFSVALRHWLEQRTKFQADTTGHDTNVDLPTSAS